MYKERTTWEEETKIMTSTMGEPPAPPSPSEETQDPEGDHHTKDTMNGRSNV
jgi:hypothetical protein